MPTFAKFLTKEQEDELARVANQLVRPGHGLLAADESTGTIGKRFEKIGLANTEENRRAYREMLFTCAPQLCKAVSGVILYEETLYQKTSQGVPFVELLKANGILPGIKLDKGLVPLGGTHGEQTTQGLDGLAERVQKYKKEGAVFAKWRNVLTIGAHTPSYQAMVDNAEVLARYASITQANGLVPIVEPEVLLDGSHDLETAQRVSEQVLSFVYKALRDQNVFLEGTLLKPNMVTPGESCPQRATPQEVARATVTTLQRTVPSAVAGVVFLSGGQSEEDATVHLNAINAYSGWYADVPEGQRSGSSSRKPWALTFSFARALQGTALQVWNGKPENVEAAQRVLLARALANGQAALGKYVAGSCSGGTESQFIAKHVY